jgi:hypothetical protein
VGGVITRHVVTEGKYKDKQTLATPKSLSFYLSTLPTLKELAMDHPENS